jgi:hypothetical protein
MTKFTDPNSRGCARGCEEVGWQDFPEGGYKLQVEKGIQRVKIYARAKSKGDVGIARHFEVLPGEVYRLTACVRIRRMSVAFKARINMAARKREGPQLEEFNERVEEITPEPVERAVRAKIPPGTEQLSVRVKFHTDEVGEWGDGEIYAMKLERLR